MSDTILAFRGPLGTSGATSWTVFSGLDLSAYQSAKVFVVCVDETDPGDNTLSTSSTGYTTLSPSAKPKEGNLQAATVQAVLTAFENDAPTDSEEFIVTSANPAVFAALLVLTPLPA